MEVVFDKLLMVIRKGRGREKDSQRCWRVGEGHLAIGEHGRERYIFFVM